MKKTIISIALALAALVGFTACEKEINTGKDVIEGLPVNSIKLNLSAPSDDVIAVTRASAEVETKVQNMALLFYKAGTDDKPIIIYVDKDGMGTPTMLPNGSSASTSTNYRYTVDLNVADKGITTGDWYLYAIANYNTKFCNVEMDEIKQLTRDEFLKYCVLKNNRSLDIVENSVLMTGNYCESGNFGDDGSLTLEYDNKEDESCRMNGVIHLRRIVAKISFEFANGSDNVTFTPEAYSIHEYSRSSTLLERPNSTWTSKNDVTCDDGYIGVEDESQAFHSHADGENLSITNKKIEFYMLENVQKAIATPDKWEYTERERRVSAESREFKYAPEHGTYVIVKGQYKDSKYSGDVTYTIHLGDFSKEHSYAYDNFSIRRNYHYTYKITVNGVNSIVTEAQANDYNEPQPGAEGNIIGDIDQSFNIRLDAHYENVLLKLTIPKKTGSVDDYSVMVNTPYSKNEVVTMKNMEEDTSEKDTSTVDYRWIRFGAPATTSTFKAYAKNSTTDIFSLLKEIKAQGKLANGTYDHFIVEDGYVYTTAYVNEYYYEDKIAGAANKGEALRQFINADDRNMTIAFSGINVSKDQHSTYTGSVVFSIQQRSIKSFYNLDVDNPFGVELVEETAISQMSTYLTSITGTESLNGWSNVPSSLYGNNTKWETVVDIANNGYISATQETISGLKSTTNVEYQCLSRNRDENGNNAIDANEIKWYLPAVDQCKIYWYGMNSLVEEARIKMTTDASSVNNYWTSTNSLEIWWADEGSAYGTFNSNYALYQKIPKIRCVRSLKNTSGTVSDVSSIKDDVISLSGLDSRSIRETGTVNGEYSEHFRGEPVDMLPEAFKVADADLSCKIKSGTTTTTKTTFTNTEIKSGNWCQDYYAEMTDSTDLGSWRIPNEKELSLMLKYSENLTTSISTYTAAKSKYARSSTVSMVYYVQNAEPRFITTDGDGTANYFKLRCVRDATPDTSVADTDKSSNTFESGGNVIK